MDGCKKQESNNLIIEDSKPKPYSALNILKGVQEEQKKSSLIVSNESNQGKKQYVISSQSLGVFLNREKERKKPQVKKSGLKSILSEIVVIDQQSDSSRSVSLDSQSSPRSSPLKNILQQPKPSLDSLTQQDIQKSLQAFQAMQNKRLPSKQQVIQKQIKPTEAQASQVRKNLLSLHTNQKRIFESINVDSISRKDFVKAVEEESDDEEPQKQRNHQIPFGRRIHEAARESYFNQKLFNNNKTISLNSVQLSEKQQLDELDALLDNDSSSDSSSESDDFDI